MKIVKEFSHQELFFDSNNSKSSKATINLGQEVIHLDFDLIIGTQFSGGNMGQQFEELKEFLNLGMYSKSPCGGFVNFYRQEGTKGGKYILFSGVNEVANSHYIVTMHKVILHP